MTQRNTDKPEDSLAVFDDDFGSAIAGALAPDRPDAESFEAGVRDRVRDRDRVQDKQAPTMPARRSGPSTWLRRAASIVPPTLLPPALAPLTLARTGTAAAAAGVATKAGWKLIPLYLALPLTILLGGVVTIWFAFQKRQRPQGAQHERKDWKDFRMQHAMQEWRLRFIPKFAIASCAVFALSFVAAAEAIVLGYLLTMFFVLSCSSELARTGFASRNNVSGLCHSSLVMFSIHANQALHSGGIAAELMTTGLWILAIAAGYCTLATRWSWRRKAISTLVALLPMTLFVLVFHGFGETAVTSSATARQAADDWRGETRRSLSDWSELVMVLRDATEGDFEPSPQALAHAQEMVDKESSDNPLFLLSATRAGILTAEQARGWLDDSSVSRTLRRLREGKRWRRFSEHDEFALHVARRATGAPLDDDLRGHLVDQVLPTAIDDHERTPDLEDLQSLWEALELIGRAEGADTLTARTRETLPNHWSGHIQDEGACFAAYPDSFERDDSGNVVQDYLSSVWLDDTNIAIQLMARCGVPEGIDLIPLDEYLTTMASHTRLRAPRSQHLLAAALRAQLRSFPEWAEQQEEPTPFLRLPELATLLGALLLAALCIALTLGAPHAEEPASPPDPA